MHDKIRAIIDQCLEANHSIDIRYDEPMSEHTTFKVGGPADCLLCPEAGSFPGFSAAVISRARAANIPVFILGGGANIVVSDRGIRGIVLDTGAYSGLIANDEGVLSFYSGTSMDEAAECAASLGLSGLEFLSGMPGSIGGAVWMNARAYGREIADALAWTEVIDFSANGGEFSVTRIKTGAGFGYKRSPFQGRDQLILAAGFNLKPSDANEIRRAMETNRQDRKSKGHYSFPCAGSAFKNSRGFGKPTGQIIDELGLCGFSVGGAQIAPFHGNIVINTGGAAAADILSLMNEVAARVKTLAGFILEPEILFVGEWGE